MTDRVGARPMHQELSRQTDSGLDDLFGGPLEPRFPRRLRARPTLRRALAEHIGCFNASDIPFDLGEMPDHTLDTICASSDEAAARVALARMPRGCQREMRRVAKRHDALVDVVVDAAIADRSAARARRALRQLERQFRSAIGRTHFATSPFRSSPCRARSRRTRVVRVASVKSGAGDPDPEPSRPRAPRCSAGGAA